ncbi:hypothetical protein EHS25_006065 [Saitozyma podzolica]|uniref:Uncharacterized protein n=1 Tax=Saitozyma podzolica TaxID=1890683 RepID=A0A427XT99_9TREE|nr:hypothetical protein EHS25_006065 [Saitozyma podzolica]
MNPSQTQLRRIPKLNVRHRADCPSDTYSNLLRAPLLSSTALSSLPFPLPASPSTHLTNPNPEGSINRFGVRAGQSLAEWEKAGWVWEGDPRGWAEWSGDVSGTASDRDGCWDVAGSSREAWSLDARGPLGTDFGQESLRFEGQMPSHESPRSESHRRKGGLWSVDRRPLGESRRQRGYFHHETSGTSAKLDQTGRVPSFAFASSVRGRETAQKSGILPPGFSSPSRRATLSASSYPLNRSPSYSSPSPALSSPSPALSSPSPAPSANQLTLQGSKWQALQAASSAPY